MSDRLSGLRKWLEIVGLGSMTIASLVIVATSLNPRAGVTRARTTTPDNPVQLEGAPLLGASDAPIALLVFSDFQCPFCAKFATETLSALKVDFVSAGVAAIAFRHKPLEKIHPRALPAAVAAYCAHQEGHFWTMHDRLFENQSSLDEADLERYAEEIGLDASRFRECIAGSAAAAVQRDIREAENLGVHGTPTTFIGVRLKDGSLQVAGRLDGALPLEAFVDAIRNAQNFNRPWWQRLSRILALN